MVHNLRKFFFCTMIVIFTGISHGNRSSWISLCAMKMYGITCSHGKMPGYEL